MPPFVPRMARFRDHLREARGLDFDDHEALWRWSVDEPEAFWSALWAFEEVVSPGPHGPVLTEARMPGARWFPEARVSYARQILRHADPAHAAGHPAIIAEDEGGRVREVSWPALRREVGAMAMGLRALGVGPGDRVAAVLPNGPEAVMALLACAAIGAVWSVCAPDMGRAAVLSRFQQIEPVIFIAADAVRHGGRVHDRAEEIAALREGLPTVRALVLVESGLGTGPVEAEARWSALAAGEGTGGGAEGFEPLWLPFDHPLWIVYSSGTTGRPKALVHGHGGVILANAAGGLHLDLGASYDPNSEGERFHWFSSTGWIMWNCQVAGLQAGATILLWDGSPSGPREAPDWGTLWRFASRHRATWLGSGAAFFEGCRKAGIDPWEAGDLGALRALGSTGSPLAEAVQDWGSAAFARRGRAVWWCNISGGTDIAATFLAGHRERPPAPGRLQCRTLGAAVEAWDDEGRAVTGQVGELVCTRPLPSMPLRLWGDADGARLRESYFEPWPGVWRHGDWIEMHDDGSATIHGRSDATINRHGLRLGTAEIYAAVEALPEVVDSMAVDLEHRGRASWLGLFVVLAEGSALDAGLEARIRGAIREAVSPRFLPDAIIAAPAVPRTLSGKKQEVPIRRLLLGHPPERVLDREAMANPGCLSFYLDLAARGVAAA